MLYNTVFDLEEFAFSNKMPRSICVLKMHTATGRKTTSECFGDLHPGTLAIIYIWEKSRKCWSAVNTQDDIHFIKY